MCFILVVLMKIVLRLQFVWLNGFVNDIGLDWVSSFILILIILFLESLFLRGKKSAAGI